MKAERTRALALLATGILLAVAFGFRIASARADTPLGSYSAIASAPGMEFTEDEPAAQAHPEGQGSAPYTTSLISGGGLGYALSSIAWPGAYGGNAGSLILVAVPSQVGGVPLPDAIAGAVKTVSPALQYPIRAEARTGSAPDAAYGQIPGTTLTAHAGADDSHSVADVQGAQQPGAATYGNMHSDSSSTVTGSSVKALANSVLHDINIGGGAIKMKSLTSTATATTDGKTPSATGGTIVQGLTVGGQPASLDQDGLHIGSSSQPANAVANDAANKTLGGLGMKVYVSQPQQDTTNGVTSYTAGSVVFTWIPPSNPSGNVFVLTLGGARVAVAAGAGFGEPSQQSGDTGAAGVAPSDTGGASALGTTSGSPDLGGVSAPAAATGTAPNTGSRGGTAQNIGGVNIAKTFGGVGAVWLLAGLAGAVLIGFGATRLIAALVDNPPATCPLEVQR